MNNYNLTKQEHFYLLFSIMLPGKKRSLYEHLSLLSLEDLQAYPKKGFRWWMGGVAKSKQALAMRDYILYWRFEALSFRQQYPRAYLETLSCDALRSFLDTYIGKVPFWAYEEPMHDALQILFRRVMPRSAEEAYNLW